VHREDGHAGEAWPSSGHDRAIEGVAADLIRVSHRPYSCASRIAEEE
jgi:hypothetical protein